MPYNFDDPQDRARYLSEHSSKSYPTYGVDDPPAICPLSEEATVKSAPFSLPVSERTDQSYRAELVVAWKDRPAVDRFRVALWSEVTREDGFLTFHEHCGFDEPTRLVVLTLDHIRFYTYRVTELVRGPVDCAVTAE